MTLDRFATVTRGIAAKGDFLPTFADPEKRDLRVLENVPNDANTAVVARDWAAGMGAARYFLAYPDSELIFVEEYNSDGLVGRQQIEV